MLALDAYIIPTQARGNDVKVKIDASEYVSY